MYYKLIRQERAGKAVRGTIYSVEHRYSGSIGIYREYLTPIAPTLENADCLILLQEQNHKEPIYLEIYESRTIVQNH